MKTKYGVIGSCYTPMIINKVRRRKTIAKPQQESLKNYNRQRGKYCPSDSEELAPENNFKGWGR
jgi:hypothetical protein